MEIILGRCKNVYVYVFKRTEIRHHDRIRSARPGPTFALPSGGFWNHFVERIEVIAALSCSNSRAKKPSTAASSRAGGIVGDTKSPTMVTRVFVPRGR